VPAPARNVLNPVSVLRSLPRLVIVRQKMLDHGFV
jgi:hypothetical protein